jgi:hypothetical protein
MGNLIATGVLPEIVAGDARPVLVLVLNSESVP